MAKIYLSSTYTDLKKYRERVYLTLRQMRYDVIAMEDYVATDQRPLDKCLADVASCELYIGIFAWRYGYIPSIDNPEKKSVTELEYRKAVQEGIPRLIFLLKEHRRWPSNQKDAIKGDGEHGKRIAELRKELTQEKLVSFFEGPDQLARLVATAVHLWEMNRVAASSTRHPDDKEKALWNIPFQLNPFFTGREEILTYLYDRLHERTAATPTRPIALTGIGGIGKTQIAVQYAYRYAHVYKAVLWVRADSFEVLTSDFASLATVLHISENNEADQDEAVKVVKHWLEVNRGWLLILDSLENDVLEKLGEVVPLYNKGSILLTTRLQALGTLAESLEVNKMEIDEGATFLLHRAQILRLETQLDEAPAANQEKARQISEAMDGLPLALDQAGAYIEETRCSLSHYFDLYQTQYAQLLNRRSQFSSDHPQSVTATFLLSFEKVKQASPAAAELLQFCTFLSPDAIPEEIISQGAPELGSVLQPVAADQIKVDEAITELLKFSLIQREPNARLLSVHRLVQTVLKAEMDENARNQWVERVIRIMGKVFPTPHDANTIREAQRLLPHALEGAHLAKRLKNTFPEVAYLLNGIACYFQVQGQDEVAVPVHIEAVQVCESLKGFDHPDVAVYLSNMAGAYLGLREYKKAEDALKRAVKIDIQSKGATHPLTLGSQTNLAQAYVLQKKYREAEALFLEVLDIHERELEPDPAAKASILHSLAGIYTEQGRDEKAKLFYRRAYDLWIQALGPEHPTVAYTLSNLARIYQRQGEDEEAAALYQQALTILKKQLGLKHPNTIDTFRDYMLLMLNKCVDGKLESTAELTHQRPYS